MARMCKVDVFLVVLTIINLYKLGLISYIGVLKREIGIVGKKPKIKIIFLSHVICT